MTPEQVRTLGAQLMIAAAVCGGLYVMVADPMRKRASATEAELAAIANEHDGAAATLANLPQIVATHDETQLLAARYEDKSLPARDESVMFSQIMDLSTRAGVVVAQITPARSGASRGAGKADETLRPGDMSVRYALSGTGSYTAIAEFLEVLQTDWGYCTLKNCRLTPDFSCKEDEGVKFSMVVELLGFDASPITLGEVAGESTP